MITYLNYRDQLPPKLTVLEEQNALFCDAAKKKLFKTMLS